MAKYFDEHGYFIINDIMQDDIPFNFIIGGRGTGKTYGATKWAMEHCDCTSKFLFMRRTDAEIAMINAGNIYAEHTPETKLKSLGKQLTGVYHLAHVPEDKETEDTPENDRCTPKTLTGYHVALSTIHNIRGYSMLDVDYIIFDEFIPERGTVTRRYSGEQMLNAYETINRNRELQGRKPVKCIFLSNYNELESDIMNSFGFTDEIYKYHSARPLGIYTDDLKRLIMINESPISAQKKNTVLYQVNASKEFNDMAIDNNGALQIMPTHYYHRKTYDFLFNVGSIHVNRLRNGYYYLTGGLDDSQPTTKELNKGRIIYRAYSLGNVIAANDFVATKFVRFYNNVVKV